MKNAKILIEPDSGKKEEQVSIRLEGDLTIRNMEALKEKLAPLTEQAEKLSMEVRNVESMDLSFIQLIQSLSQSMTANGKGLSVSLSLQKEVKELLEKTGFCTETLQSL